MTTSILPVIACLIPLAVGLLTLAVVKLRPPYRYVFGVSLTAYVGIAALAVFTPMTDNIRAGFVALSMMMIVLLLAVQLSLQFSLWARASEH